MPYIKAKDRVAAAVNPVTPGELNFAICQLLIGYTNRGALSYGAINDCLGALEGAKLEFYRRVAVPYEETKLKENGDVF